MHVCSVFPSVFLVFQHMLPFRLSPWHTYLTGAWLFMTFLISVFMCLGTLAQFLLRAFHNMGI